MIPKFGLCPILRSTRITDIITNIIGFHVKAGNVLSSERDKYYMIHDVNAFLNIF